MPLLGAGYAIVEHQGLTKGLPASSTSLILFVGFRLFRIAASVLKQLNGVCIYAQAKPIRIMGRLSKRYERRGVGFLTQSDILNDSVVQACACERRGRYRNYQQTCT
jgi:hypothetical protein